MADTMQIITEIQMLIAMTCVFMMHQFFGAGHFSGLNIKIYSQNIVTRPEIKKYPLS